MSRYIPGPRNRVDSKPRIPSEPLTEPLLIRLIEDVGLLPAGFTYELPRFEAELLLQRRKAIAVGSVRGQIADMVLTDAEFEDATA